MSSKRRPAGHPAARRSPRTPGVSRWWFYEDGRYQPSGFVHARCVAEYFGTREILLPARHLSSTELSAEDLAELQQALG